METNQFKDTQFMTADEKRRVLNAWVRFLKGGLKWEQFTKALYEHLIMHCSFIAHYNRHGFYCTYFENPEDTIRFLSQFDPNGDRASVEYGWNSWLGDDYEDINNAMCQVLRPFMDDLRARLMGTAKNDDLNQAKALLVKHGIKTDGIEGL
jgi:hypothetical protein